MQSRLGKISDIPGVLKLQSENLYSELTQIQRRRGFVTTPFTRVQLTEIIDQKGLFVTEAHETIIAYAFAGSWQYFAQWPIFPFMTARFPNILYQGMVLTTENTFQYGPVCIQIDFRGKKLLNEVFEEMRLLWSQRFPVSVTFINQLNEVSMRAHRKIGWEIVDEFHFNTNDYYTLAFDMTGSVL